jgi:hypothetical protein
MIPVLLAACVSLALSPAQMQHAYREGAALALASRPYAVAPWVIYQSKDPLRAQRDRAGIDAIVVETPYERIRYHAYLESLQDDKPSIGFYSRIVEASAPDRFGILIYAHSRTEIDREFFNHFHQPTLTLDDGRRLAPGGFAIFGASTDFYDVDTFREERVVGSVSFAFPLPMCATPMQLDLTDAYGTHYRVRFDLRNYR